MGGSGVAVVVAVVAVTVAVVGGRVLVVARHSTVRDRRAQCDVVGAAGFFAAGVNLGNAGC